jgi:translation initiation factor 1
MDIFNAKRTFPHTIPAMNHDAFKTLGVVYSTEYGEMCPSCGKPVAGCLCRQTHKTPKGNGVVRVGRETKGRKGNGVTVITGIPLHPDGLLNLAKQLKQQCGSGGTVKGGVIEIQGEHRDVLVEILQKKGYSVKRSGG